MRVRSNLLLAMRCPREHCDIDQGGGQHVSGAVIVRSEVSEDSDQNALIKGEVGAVCGSEVI